MFTRALRVAHLQHPLCPCYFVCVFPLLAGLMSSVTCGYTVGHSFPSIVFGVEYSIVFVLFVSLLVFSTSRLPRRGSDVDI